MEYQIGDQVIHLNYGPGVITGIEEKRIADEPCQYYVVKTGELTLWVPLDATEDRIRFPLPRAELKAHLDSLRSAGDDLPDFHRDRFGVLAERMRTRSVPEICLVIRDLAGRSKSHSLNNNDREVMSAARELLLNEWTIVAGITRAEARAALERILADQNIGPDML
ncbi:MAG TPA: CarD family transcriptional regulator [Anaerolineales bacterium]|nr:CarD family transcriptional regulator [Anaerolineales bacterium]